MKLKHPQSQIEGGHENGSVLIIVLWVCIGLVSIALYFANSMTFELRAADNRLNGIAADQAIEGAQRYISYVLENYATNGAVPDSSQFKCDAVEVGDAKFWLIGRDVSAENSSDPVFGLVDEGGKFNLNTVNTNALSYLPGMPRILPRLSRIGATRTARCRWIIPRSATHRNTRRSRAWMNCGSSLLRM